MCSSCGATYRVVEKSKFQKTPSAAQGLDRFPSPTQLYSVIALVPLFSSTHHKVPGNAERGLLLLSRTRNDPPGGSQPSASFTPLGLRSHRKTERMQFRRDGTAAEPRRWSCRWSSRGAAEEESGRWSRSVQEPGILFHLKDRKEGESVSRPAPRRRSPRWSAQGVTSYRQLPVTLYQIRTHSRDEMQQHFGLMHGREFLILRRLLLRRRHRGLDHSYQDTAYRRVFKRCSLDFTSRPGAG